RSCARALPSTSCSERRSPDARSFSHWARAAMARSSDCSSAAWPKARCTAPRCRSSSSAERPSRMIDWSAFDRALAARRRAIVDGFVDFLPVESVSQRPEKVRIAGEGLAAALRARGLDGRVLETGGNPAIFGQRRVPGTARTVLIYCHYDTKPIPL